MNVQYIRILDIPIFSQISHTISNFIPWLPHFPTHVQLYKLHNYPHDKNKDNAEKEENRKIFREVSHMEKDARSTSTNADPFLEDLVLSPLTPDGVTEGPEID